MNPNIGSVTNKTDSVVASPGCVSENCGDFRRQPPLCHPNRSEIHGLAQIYEEKDGEVSLSQPSVLQDYVPARSCGGRPVYGSGVITYLVFGNRLELCRSPQMAAGPDSEIMLTRIPANIVINLCNLCEDLSHGIWTPSMISWITASTVSPSACAVNSKKIRCLKTSLATA